MDRCKCFESRVVLEEASTSAKILKALGDWISVCAANEDADRFGRPSTEHGNIK